MTKLSRSLRGLKCPPPSLMHPANFLLATRDTGYKTTSLAIAELIDNSLQAHATEVHVEVTANKKLSTNPIEITVSDNGSGMDPGILADALTFGGSTRFDDRSSLGRYGMGLPNGALSRAQHIEVYSWTDRQVWMIQLDIDAIVKNKSQTLPPVQEVEDPPFFTSSNTGTVVRLLNCDRLEFKRVSTIERHLIEDLGRIYRYFIGDAINLTINSTLVEANDPLMLDLSGRAAGVREFGDVLIYRLEGNENEGSIEVRFSELPVERWHSLSLSEKRQLRITNAPSVSILRAGREIDRGWFFMGNKRRENYDDWWRCEIHFEPILDELFGINHTKQAISPTEKLTNLLAKDLEPIARSLNRRVRKRFELLKVSTPLCNAEKRAAHAEHFLPPLPKISDPISLELKQTLAAFKLTRYSDYPYQLVISELPMTTAFEAFVERERLVVVLNSQHPLYRDLYGPLAISETPSDQETATHVALTVLAIARAEWLDTHGIDQVARHKFRQAWSDILTTFFNVPT